MSLWIDAYALSMCNEIIVLSLPVILSPWLRSWYPPGKIRIFLTSITRCFLHDKRPPPYITEKNGTKQIFKWRGFRVTIIQGKQGIYIFIFGRQGKHEIYQNN